MNAAGYVRVSTTLQAEEGVSLEAQEAAIYREAERQGLTVGAIYRDVQSAKDDARPNYRRLVNDIRNGRWAAVITWDFDRLVRDVGNGADLLTALIEGRCRPISIAGPIDVSSPIGRAMYHIRNVFGAMEREEIAQRVRMAYHHLVESGQFRGGRCWYGYHLREGVMLPNPDTAPIVLRIYLWYAQGHSTVAITRLLNAEGVPAQRARHWSPTTVLNVLRQTVQRGYRRFGEAVGSCPVPAIVPPDVVAAVDARLESQRWHRGPLPHANTWARLLRCHCGGYTAAMRLGRGRGYAYIRCNAKNTGPVCGTRSVRLDVAEAFAARIAAEIAPLEPPHEPPETDEAAELLELDARERDLNYALLEARSITREYHARMLREIRERRMKIGRVRVPAMAPGLFARWDALTLTERNLALRYVCDTATLDETGITVQFAPTGWHGMPVGATCSREGLIHLTH